MENDQGTDPNEYQYRYPPLLPRGITGHRVQDDSSGEQPTSNTSAPMGDSIEAGPSNASSQASHQARGRTEHQTPSRRTFECQTCHKKYDRIARVKACRNSHLGVKPYSCAGECGVQDW